MGQLFTLISSSYNTPEVLKVMLQSFVVYHKNVQNIIISENSTNDETSKMLDENNITYLRRPGRGHSQSLDECFERCETKYALVVDSDVIFQKNTEEIIDLAERKHSTLLGEICGDRGGHSLYPRINPWFMIVNVDDIKKYGIKFHDEKRITETGSEGFYKNVPIQKHKIYNTLYDVGSTFFADVQKVMLNIYSYKADPEFYLHAEGISWHRQSGVDRFVQHGDRIYRIWQTHAEEFKNINIKDRFEGVEI